MIMTRSQRSMPPSVETYDPRQGQDFQMPSGKHGDVVFSSLQHGCVVIRMSWMRGWRVMRIPVQSLDSSVVNNVLQATAQLGFLSVCPADSLRGFSGLGSLQVHRYGDAFFSHYEHDQETVAAFLNEVSCRGTYEEWLIGSSIKEIDPLDVKNVNRRNHSPDLFYFLTRFSRIGSVFSFNLDTGEFLAVFRTFDGYEDVVSTIVESLQRTVR